MGLDFLGRKGNLEGDVAQPTQGRGLIIRIAHENVDGNRSVEWSCGVGRLEFKLYGTAGGEHAALLHLSGDSGRQSGLHLLALSEEENGLRIRFPPRNSALAFLF